MRIFGLGPLELAIILGIILLLFGPKQLPKLGKTIGQTMKSLREGVEGKLEEVDEEETPAVNAKADEAAPAEAASKTEEKTA